MTLVFWYKSKSFREDILFSRQQDRLPSERACYNLIGEKNSTRTPLLCLLCYSCRVMVCLNVSVHCVIPSNDDSLLGIFGSRTCHLLKVFYSWRPTSSTIRIGCFLNRRQRPLQVLQHPAIAWRIFSIIYSPHGSNDPKFDYSSHHFRQEDHLPYDVKT